MRANNRHYHEIRPITITPNYIHNNQATLLICNGNTKVICSASYQNTLPRFLKGSNQGWLTAEYGMLPYATHTRNTREAAQGKQSGRTQEIQRLIGRCLRNTLDLKLLPEITINIDCDVIQADGATRCAAITGASVALQLLIQQLLTNKIITTNPSKYLIAGISVGILNGEILLDLDYQEDKNIDTDMNIIMTEHGNFVEIQGTAEQAAFSPSELQQIIAVASDGIKQIISIQQQSIS